MPSVHTVTLVPLVALLPFQWDNQTGRFLLCPAPSPPFLWLLSLALLLSCVLLAEYEMQDGWLLSQPAHPQPPKPFCAVVFGWQYHPDKQAAGAAAEERTRQFLEIHQAWKVLGNEETKQEYDLQQRGFADSSSDCRVPGYALCVTEVDVPSPAMEPLSWSTSL
ncbi:dnaJ homolog subfamily C member 24 isoform 2-T2 [Geothlypis trichas]